MNFNDPMPYSYFSGRRDGGPEYIRNLLGWMELQAESPEAAKQYTDDDVATEVREEERARDYLRQPMCHDDKDYR